MHYFSRFLFAFFLIAASQTNVESEEILKFQIYVGDSSWGLHTLQFNPTCFLEHTGKKIPLDFSKLDLETTENGETFQGFRVVVAKEMDEGTKKSWRMDAKCVVLHGNACFLLEYPFKRRYLKEGHPTRYILNTLEKSENGEKQVADYCSKYLPKERYSPTKHLHAQRLGRLSNDDDSSMMIGRLFDDDLEHGESSSVGESSNSVKINFRTIATAGGQSHSMTPFEKGAKNLELTTTKVEDVLCYEKSEEKNTFMEIFVDNGKQTPPNDQQEEQILTTNIVLHTKGAKTLSEKTICVFQTIPGNCHVIKDLFLAQKYDQTYYFDLDQIKLAPRVADDETSVVQQIEQFEEAEIIREKMGGRCEKYFVHKLPETYEEFQLKPLNHQQESTQKATQKASRFSKLFSKKGKRKPKTGNE